MRRGLLRTVARSQSHGSNRNAAKPGIQRCRLLGEMLEDRCLLSIGSPQLELFRVSPALFAENQGQWADASIRFLHNGDGANVAMTDAGPVFQVFRREAANGANDPIENAPPAPALGEQAAPENYVTETLQFSAHFLGANEVSPIGLERSETQFNYFVGPQESWHSRVPTYQVVAYEGLYQGIDLLTWGQRDSLKYEFHVAPGADYRQIQVRYDGISALSIAENGSLAVDVGNGWGSVVDDAPYVYQQIGGEKVEVAGHFRLLDNATYSFEITGSYDPTRELVIDPDLAWSTYLGGSGHDTSYGIAVDSAGNALVTGQTNSTAFSGANNSYHGGYDAFVAKVNSDGTSAWATYLGGNGNDLGWEIAADGVGNALVTGETNSTDFSGANNSYQGGQWDAFAAKVNSDGMLAWATYVGGSGDDSGEDIAVDAAGNALVTGETRSTDFLGANNGYHGGYKDAFVAKVNSDGILAWSTYVGGSSHDWGGGIALDGAGNVLVTGTTTSSTDFSGANNSFHGSDPRLIYGDAFVAKLNSAGSLTWATYLGGTNIDTGTCILADNAGDALVIGYTFSTDFSGANNSYHGGQSDAFVSKVNSDGTSAWATYLGGNGSDGGWGIAADGAFNVLVTGNTDSTDFSGANNSYHGGQSDAFVGKINSADTLLWATYLGGSGYDRSYGIAVNSAANALVTGETSSTDFLGENNGYHGGYDAFVAKLSGLAGPGQDSVYNSAFLTDGQLERWWSMSVEQVRTFLAAQNSYFRQPVADVDGVLFDLPVVLVSAAQQYRINPQALLVTLQKESVGVTRSGRPSATRMGLLMGAGAASTARAQVYEAARLYRAYLDELNQNGVTRSGWRVGVGKSTVDGVMVVPATRAVAALFTYTPYAGAQWGGNQPQWGGTYLFHHFWNAFGFGSEIPALAAPTGLTARAVSHTEIALSWDLLPGAVGFEVQRATGSAGPWQTIATVGPETTTYQDAAGLSADTMYYYRVAAYYDAGLSPYSRTVSARPQEALAPRITHVGPATPVATGSSQPFTIHGENFHGDATVNLRSFDGTPGGRLYENRVVSDRSSVHITINPNFGTLAREWSVEVLNPGGESSGQRHFLVRAPAIGSGEVGGDLALRLPFPNGRAYPVTQGYTGYSHTGYEVDFGLEVGTPVVAVASGDVVATGSYAGNSRTGEGLTPDQQAGIYVKIRHQGSNSEWSSSYLHLSRRAVKVGDTVQAGKVIGYSGNTGWSTGPHLHFHMRDAAGTGVRPVPMVGAIEGTGMTTITDFEYGKTYRAASPVVANGTFAGGLLDGWIVSGSGMVQVVQGDIPAGEYLARLATGSPVVLSQVLTTPESSFDLTFNWQYETTTGTLDILLNSVVLATLDAPDAIPDEPTTFSLTVADSALFSLENAVLAFRFDGPSGSQVLLGNIAAEMPGIDLDLIPPTLTLTAPALTNITTPPVSVTVTDTGSGVTDGTAVALDVDLNNDGDFSGAGEESYTTSTLSSGTASFNVGPALAEGTYPIRARVSDQAGNEGTSAVATVVVDTTRPTVIIGDPSASLTAGGPITYTVSYADANFNVSTLGVGDVMLNQTGTASGTVSVTGTGLTRSVTVSGMTGDGTLGISLAADTASDLAGNLAPAAGASSTFLVDNMWPTVTLSGPSAPLTAGGPISYTVTYADENFNASNLSVVDVTLNHTGTANGTVSVSSGTGLTRTVTISDVTGDGTLGIFVAAGTASDTAGNLAPAPVPSDTFVVDNTAPTISVSSPSASVTGRATITYTVIYADANFNASTLTNGDVTLNRTGTANGTVSVSSGVGLTRTVSISNIVGDGALGISVAAGTASDTAGNLAPAAGASITFVVDNIAPTISIGNPSAPITAGGPITYAVIYEDANFNVSSLGVMDVTLNRTGTANGILSVSSGVGLTRTATISDITGDGTLGISLATGTASDTAGNLAPTAGPSETFVVDNTGPSRPSLNVADVPIGGGTSYFFTVTYTDNNGINVSTLDDSDVVVTGPNLYRQLATFDHVDINADGTPRTATYRITPPGGMWDPADKGDYTVWMQPDEVTDTTGNPVSPTILGWFAVKARPDKSPPKASLNAPNVVSAGDTSYAFTVTYTDNVEVRVSTLDSLDVRVTGPYRYRQLATLDHVDVNTNGTPRTATYRITPPAGAWSAASNGVYTVTMQAKQVKDTSGKPVAARKLGAFTVDTVAPTASLKAPNVAKAGGKSYTFTVTYADNLAVHAATLDNSDILVTGPNGFSQAAMFVSVNSRKNGTPRKATYRIAPPGGSWDATDNGTYTITIQPNQVADKNGNPVPAGVLGSFTVDVPSAPVAKAVSKSSSDMRGPPSSDQAALVAAAADAAFSRLGRGPRRDVAALRRVFASIDDWLW